LLDFRPKRQKSGYLGWGSQRRVLTLVGISGLVLLLTLQVGDPEHWKWINWEQTEPAKKATTHVPSRQEDSGASTATSEPGTGDRVPPIAGADVPPIEIEPTPPPKPPTKGDLYPGVRNDYLNLVRDDTVFLPDEADAWFHLFDVLRQPEAPPLEPYSLGSVSYLQLDQQPGAYRGRVVSLHGIVRGAKLIEAPVNAFNISRYYQLWLQPERSSPALVVVYSLVLPTGFPLGDSLQTPVSLTGIFYKRWTYASQEGITTAPLLVAKTVDWTPTLPPAPVVRQPVGREVVVASLAALVLALAALALIAWRTRTSGGKHGTPANAPVGAALSGLDLQTGADFRDTSP
jgi:hypothetical protein